MKRSQKLLSEKINTQVNSVRCYWRNQIRLVILSLPVKGVYQLAFHGCHESPEIVNLERRKGFLVHDFRESSPQSLSPIALGSMLRQLITQGFLKTNPLNPWSESKAKKRKRSGFQKVLREHYTNELKTSL